jgi:hypothetical protein
VKDEPRAPPETTTSKEMPARRHRRVVTHGIALAIAALVGACAADPGDDLKGESTDTGAVATDVGTSDTNVSHDTAPTTDTDPSPDSAHPTDSGVASDSSSTGDTLADTGADMGADALTDTGADSGTDVTTDTGSGLDVVPVDASCPTCPLTVRYQCMNTLASTNESKPWLKIVNTGASPQPMSELTVRYWFTEDGTKPLEYHCDYAKIDCANVTGTFVALPTAVTGADHYLEISFGAGAGSIAPGADSGEIQNRFNKSDFSTWTQSNDYSWDPTKTTYADWPNVTLYRAGTLVWGTEPS